jgi:hypothetical protein
MSDDTAKALQQSVHWEERKDFTEDVARLFGDFPGFPFNEPWPRWWHGRSFTLITYRGTRHESAIVDDSRQYRDEGLCWRTPSGPVGKHLVIAWQEEAQ